MRIDNEAKDGWLALHIVKISPRLSQSRVIDSQIMNIHSIHVCCLHNTVHSTKFIFPCMFPIALPFLSLLYYMEVSFTNPSCLSWMYPHVERWRILAHPSTNNKNKNSSLSSSAVFWDDLIEPQRTRCNIHYIFAFLYVMLLYNCGMQIVLRRFWDVIKIFALKKSEL